VRTHGQRQGRDPQRARAADGLAVEGDDEIITPEQIANKLGDSLAWTEGIGVVDIDYIGKIETIEEDEVTN